MISCSPKNKDKHDKTINSKYKLHLLDYLHSKKKKKKKQQNHPFVSIFSWLKTAFKFNAEGLKVKLTGLLDLYIPV